MKFVLTNKKVLTHFPEPECQILRLPHASECLPTVTSSLPGTPLPTTAGWISNFTDIVSKFSLRTADIPDDDMCYIVPGRPETISECHFNPDTQTFVVIHGWTVRLLFNPTF